MITDQLKQIIIHLSLNFGLFPTHTTTSSITIYVYIHTHTSKSPAWPMYPANLPTLLHRYANPYIYHIFVSSLIFLLNEKVNLVVDI